MGHTVLCPTLIGNRPADNRATIGLAGATQSLVDFLERENLRNVRLVGHRYGGMAISVAADKVPRRIARLVYHNAFVPPGGQCLNDMVPAHYIGMFDSIAATNGHAFSLPFPVWREAFMWHLRLSERLGLFRLVEGQGSHEVCFTNPALLAQKIVEAGRD